MQLETATKAQFAAMIGVTPGRVSQYISAGKLGANELEGEGRAAKVRVAPALAALKIRLDASQMTGNGLSTNLNPQPAITASPAAEPVASDSLDLQYKQAKLDQQLAINRRQAEEEKARAGVYILAEDARAETARLASKLMQGFEGGLADIATALAARYELPQRDVVHMVRAQFREVRAKIAERLAQEGKAMPRLIEDAEDTP